MTKIRIDPGQRSQKKREIGQTVGGAIGSVYGQVGSTIGAAVGDAIGSVFSKGNPVFPVEVDTDTNIVQLLAWPANEKATPIAKYAAERRKKEAEPIQAALQSVWDTGTIPDSLPKRYGDIAAELISQRELLRQVTESAPVAPIETEGGSYSGAYSMADIVPPGGFAGFAQMTPASKAAQGFTRLSKFAKKLVRSRNKRKKKAATKRKRKGGGKRRKLVKGSAAAKRFMANLRKKRR